MGYNWSITLTAWLTPELDTPKFQLIIVIIILCTLVLEQLWQYSYISSTSWDDTNIYYP